MCDFQYNHFALVQNVLWLMTQFFNIAHHLPLIPNPTHRQFLYLTKYFCMKCLATHFDTRMSKRNQFTSAGGPWAYFLLGGGWVRFVHGTEWYVVNDTFSLSWVNWTSPHRGPHRNRPRRSPYGGRSCPRFSTGRSTCAAGAPFPTTTPTTWRKYF